MIMGVVMLESIVPMTYKNGTAWGLRTWYIMVIIMKVDIAFSMQMAEQGSGEDVVNTMLMHGSWKTNHDSGQTVSCGVESI
jgi:hypothetical protein